MAITMVTVKTTISLPHEVNKASLTCDRALDAVSKINCSFSLLLVHRWQVPDVTDDGPACHHQVQVLHHWVATAVPESIAKVGVILQTAKKWRFCINAWVVPDVTEEHHETLTVSHPGRTESSITLRWELQNLQIKTHTPNQDATPVNPSRFSIMIFSKHCLCNYESPFVISQKETRKQI